MTFAAVCKGHKAIPAESHPTKSMLHEVKIKMKATFEK